MTTLQQMKAAATREAIARAADPARAFADDWERFQNAAGRMLAEHHHGTAAGYRTAAEETRAALYRLEQHPAQREDRP